MMRTAEDVATPAGALLPHLFTLTRRNGRLFSVTLIRTFTRLPVKKHGALCCPDFPPRLCRSDRAVCRHKIKHFRPNRKAQIAGFGSVCQMKRQVPIVEKKGGTALASFFPSLP